MPDFPEITLTHIKPQVTLDVPSSTISFPRASLTVKEYETFRDRVDALLRRYKLIPSRNEERSHGSHPFLTNNTKEISRLRRGKLKRAPWFLRPFYDAVVDKNEY